MTTISFRILVILFVGHSSCAISMLLLNKFLISRFPFQWMVVFIQNAGTCVLATLQDCRSGKVPNCGQNFGKAESPRKVWVVALWFSFMFVVTLGVSLHALRFVPVPLYIIGRNMVPGTVAILEWVLYQRSVPPLLVVALLMSMCGGTLYGIDGVRKKDGVVNTTIGSTSFMYMVLVVVSCATCAVTDKASIGIFSQQNVMTATEANRMRCFLSLPIALVFAFFTEVPAGPADDTHRSVVVGDVENNLNRPLTHTFHSVSRLMSLDGGTVGLLFGSIVPAFGIGVLHLMLLKEVPAVSTQVSGILSNVIAAVLSRTIFQNEAVGFPSWCGFALSTFGAGLFVWKKNGGMCPAQCVCADLRSESPQSRCSFLGRPDRKSVV